MPRQARLDVPGVLQHVIARGIERREIFRDDEDRKAFVTRLSALLTATHTHCYAWALVPNHFHLLLLPTQTTLTSFMRRLQTGYAVTFNLRHRRSGHLFQNRYKSIVCDQEEYLLALVRYIGLNPLRAGLVRDLEALDRHPWSSHAVLMGHQSLEGQCVEEVLARFGARRKDAVRNYRAFVAAGVALGRQEELVGGGLRRSRGAQADKAQEGEGRPRQAYDERVLGSGVFVEALWKEAVPADRSVPMLPLEELTERVAHAYGVEVAEIRRRRRLANLSEARAAVCYLAVRRLGYKGVEVGRHPGVGPGRHQCGGRARRERDRTLPGVAAGARSVGLVRRSNNVVALNHIDRE